MTDNPAAEPAAPIEVGALADIILSAVTILDVKTDPDADARINPAFLVTVSVPAEGDDGAFTETTIRYEPRAHLLLGFQPVAITRAAPVEWPPRPGDMWRDQGGWLWLAQSTPRHGGGDEGRIIMVPAIEPHTGKNYDEPNELHRTRGPLKLMWRDPQYPTGTAF